jgi:hypothetical protein
MKRYLVWEAGESREDAVTINAHDHGDAVTTWARHTDAKYADYTIVNGDPVTVMVAEDFDGSPEFEYIVGGEQVLQYTAWKAAIPEEE